MKIKKNTLAKFFGTTRQSINNWEKDKTKYAVTLINKYIDENDVLEFMEDGIVSKLELNQQALDLQKKIYQDVVNLVKKKKSLNTENPEKKIFFTFGKFLENGLNDEDKMWIKSLKFEEYIKFEDSTDDFFKEKYVRFLEFKNLNILEINDHLNLMDYILFSTNNHYKFYFLKYAMWLFIPTKMEEIELEKVLKFKEIPENIKKIPGSKKVSDIFETMKFLRDVFYGK